MSSRTLTFVTASLSLCSALALGWSMCGGETIWSEMPSHRRARASVDQIVFVGGRAIVRNELSELYVSDDDGRQWRVLPETPESLRVANGKELWGAHGWPGHHEGPSARLWRSLDLGETWSHVDLELPGDRRELHARLPAGFINEPGDEPLLVMSDFQLVRPDLVTNSSAWRRVGRRISGLEPSTGTINSTATGRKHGRSIYVASAGEIFLSNDEGMTWAQTSLDLLWRPDIRCVESTCYVLSNNADRQWDGFLTTEAGTNEWRHIGFDPTAMVRALTADRRHRAPNTFVAVAFVPTNTGIYVSGVVDAGHQPWAAVLRVDRAGEITSVGHGIPVGLGVPTDVWVPTDFWVLEQAPDGTLWAGGQGAYRLHEGEWVKVWPAQGRQPQASDTPR